MNSSKFKKQESIKIPLDNSETISDDSSSNESDDDSSGKNKFQTNKKKDIPLITYQAEDGVDKPRETVTLPAPPPLKKHNPYLVKAEKRLMTTAFDDDSDEDIHNPS